MVGTMVPKEDLLKQRLDGLEKKVDDGFARLDKKIDEGLARVERKMDDGFAKVDDRFKQVGKTMDDGFARVDSDIRELRGDMNTLKYGLISATALILAALIVPALF